jgi:murein DD-endopeptidase MepM/ murein hydrolase activator NlpD
MTIHFERVKPRLLASVMVAGLVAACSSDTARFNDNPFQNPFSSRTSFDPASTASINRAPNVAPLRAAPASIATTQALPAPSQPMMRNIATPATTRLSAPHSTGSVASSAYPALAPIAPRPTTALGTSQGWTAVGGTPVVLGPGESLNTLSARYGVPVSALMAVNGLSSVNQAQPGQQIMVPAYNAVQGAGAAAAPAIPKRVASAVPAVPAREIATPEPPVRAQLRPPVREVAAKNETEAEKRAAAKLKQLKSRDEDDEDETPAVPSRAVPKTAAQPKPASPPAAQSKPVAQAMPAPSQAMPVSQDKAKLEAQRRLEAERKKVEAQKLAEQKRLEAERKTKIAARKVQDADPETTASIPEPKVPTRTAERPAAPAPVQAPAEEQAEAGNFRWPAQGRVISGFGTKSASGANDGINIAVPEGTPVRAAEGGTVIHADDALKGYGKLVLVRHPNGYVSVYAHNGEIKVKRGESVKRGQVIAASGSSGNVTSPQLHFQIRKGSQAVDPMKVLSSN